MRKNILKLIVLAGLIVLCIWQTTILWLGNMSSHNFLMEKSYIHNAIVTRPKAIWLNIGKLAYNIDENRGEDANLLMEELTTSMSSQKVKIEQISHMSYEDLFAMQGIIYEYGVAFSLDEIIGIAVTSDTSKIKVQYMFVDLSSYIGSNTYVYILGNTEEEIYKVTLPSKLELHHKTIEKINTSNASTNLLEYQASIISNQSNYIEGNVFLPLNNQKTPIIYEPLRLTNPFKEGDLKAQQKELEAYVNTFFNNPLLKEVKVTTEGSIIYSENMKTSVRYSPKGTLEFNISSKTEADKLTPLERMKKLNTFINECAGIPAYLKRGIYLRNIKEDQLNNEWTYQFGYKYDGFPIVLKENVKEELEIDAILELVIKNNQIVSGKWIVLEIDIDSEGGLNKGEFTIDFNTAIGNMDKEYNESEEIGLLQDLQCSYIIDSLDQRLKFGWMARYNDDLYYP